jgi:hypothetical protein
MALDRRNHDLDLPQKFLQAYAGNRGIALVDRMPVFRAKQEGAQETGPTAQVAKRSGKPRGPSGPRFESRWAHAVEKERLRRRAGTSIARDPRILVR